MATIEQLPDYVRKCPLCAGTGETKQTYTVGCGGGYHTSLGPCEMCTEPGRWLSRGQGYIYRGSGVPIPDSVLEQIKNRQTREEA